MLIDDDEVPPRYRAVFWDPFWRPEPPFETLVPSSPPSKYWSSLHVLAWHLVAANMDVSPWELPATLGRDSQAVMMWLIARLGVVEAHRLHTEEVRKYDVD